jgi:hypothetical protein
MHTGKRVKGFSPGVFNKLPDYKVAFITLV